MSSKLAAKIPGFQVQLPVLTLSNLFGYSPQCLPRPQHHSKAAVEAVLPSLRPLWRWNKIVPAYGAIDLLCKPHLPVVMFILLPSFFLFSSSLSASFSSSSSPNLLLEIYPYRFQASILPQIHIPSSLFLGFSVNVDRHKWWKPKCSRKNDHSGRRRGQPGRAGLLPPWSPFLGGLHILIFIGSN